MTVGIVHRLESRNAYFACRAAHRGEGGAIVLACADCGAVHETEARGIFAAIEELARREGFAVSGRIAEVKGRCAVCQSRGQP